MAKTDIRERIEKIFKIFKDTILSYTLIIAGVLILTGLFLVSFSHYPMIHSLIESWHIDIEHIIPKLIYGCIALFAIVLGIERTSDSEKIKKNLEKQSSAMEELSCKVHHISKNHEEMVYNLQFLKSRIELKNPLEFPDIIEEAIKSHVPFHLSSLFKSEFDNYTNFLGVAIKSKRVNFNNNDLFNTVYRKWLETNPQSIIYATSSPASTYYWSTEEQSNTKIEDAIIDFIKKGGEMHRVFFLTEKDFNDKDVISRMNKQIKFGVRVYTSLIQPNNHKTDFFIIDKVKKLTFRIYVNSDNSMRNFSCSVDPEYTKRFTNEWNALIDSNYTNLYKNKRISM